MSLWFNDPLYDGDFCNFSFAILLMLGAGPAGYAAAMRAHDLGKRVALVERGRVGGAGIHAGALSSKTMWHLSNDYAVARRRDRGYRAAGGIEVYYPEVCRCVETAVAERQRLLDAQLALFAAPSPNGIQKLQMRGGNSALWIDGSRAYE